jgi:hypothetical protein
MQLGEVCMLAALAEDEQRHVQNPVGTEQNHVALRTRAEFVCVSQLYRTPYRSSFMLGLTDRLQNARDAALVAPEASSRGAH